MTSRHIWIGASAAERVGAPAREGAVAWEISPDALTGSAWAHARLNGEAARVQKSALVWRVRDGRARAELELQLTRGERKTIVLTGEVAACVQRDGDLVHVDAPGQLKLTARESGGAWQVVYAWTGALAGELGLRGGVYERPRGE